MVMMGGAESAGGAAAYAASSPGPDRRGAVDFASLKDDDAGSEPLGGEGLGLLGKMHGCAPAA